MRILNYPSTFHGCFLRTHGAAAQHAQDLLHSYVFPFAPPAVYAMEMGVANKSCGKVWRTFINRFIRPHGRSACLPSFLWNDWKTSSRWARSSEGWKKNAGNLSENDFAVIWVGNSKRLKWRFVTGVDFYLFLCATCLHNHLAAGLRPKSSLFTGDQKNPSLKFPCGKAPLQTNSRGRS